MISSSYKFYSAVFAIFVYSFYSAFIYSHGLFYSSNVNVYVLFLTLLSKLLNKPQLTLDN